ncbi:MAG: polyhydroxyalkanoate granule-associated phasin [Burkholderiaceae bacterium]
MARKRSSSALSAARRLGELGLAAPQVASLRLARMALNSPAYSLEDRREFVRMVQEKPVAFAQSWAAMFQESVRLQQRLWLWWAGAAWSAWTGAWRHPPGAAQAWLRVAQAGLVPVHRKALANARRLTSRPRA